VTRGSISLAAADGSNRREVFTYTPVATHSEAPYYARPVWAADSSALRVAIPPVDPYAQPSPPTSVWHIPADGTPASLLENIATAPGSQASFSPDLSYVAYLYPEQSDSAWSGADLLITDLKFDTTITYYPKADTGVQISLENGETSTYYPVAGEIYGWSSDPRYFAFLAYPSPGLPQGQIGRLGSDAVPAYSDASAAVIKLRWVDGDRYLCLAQDALKGWVILLGKIDGPATTVASVPGADDPPAYDFAAPTVDTPLPTPVPLTPTPTAEGFDHTLNLLGLIYQTDDGLWHVNADGRSVQVFGYPDASEYHSVISPDSTQVCYTGIGTRGTSGWPT
jgi:hypothetical protein